MLRPNVKEYADSGNVRGLHYIFRDALDADPTFENWLDSYDYCEKVPGFFVEHTELTPFDNSRWKDETYWVQLKMDLMENFSKERYEYLRQMAQVYYAEKIKRIQLERAQRSRNSQDAGTSAAPGQNAVRPQPTAARENAAPAEQEARKQTPKKDLNAAENERIRQMREEIEEANRKAAEAKRKKNALLSRPGRSWRRKTVQTETEETAQKNFWGLFWRRRWLLFWPSCFCSGAAPIQQRQL